MPEHTYTEIFTDYPREVVTRIQEWENLDADTGCSAFRTKSILHLDSAMRSARPTFIVVFARDEPG